MLATSGKTIALVRGLDGVGIKTGEAGKPLIFHKLKEHTPAQKEKVPSFTPFQITAAICLVIGLFIFGLALVRLTKKKKRRRKSTLSQNLMLTEASLAVISLCIFVYALVRQTEEERHLRYKLRLDYDRRVPATTRSI